MQRHLPRAVSQINDVARRIDRSRRHNDPVNFAIGIGPAAEQEKPARV